MTSLNDNGNSVHPDCQLMVEPFFQCCCKCIYLKPVHYHCCTTPKPTDKERKAFNNDGRCVCEVRKGFACAGPEMDRVYDNWPEHSCGCECYTTLEDLERWKTKSVDPVVAFDETIKAFILSGQRADVT